jgi:hypothetical protein
MSDIGGLGQALFFVAANLIGWFSNMNAGLHLKASSIRESRMK